MRPAATLATLTLSIALALGLARPAPAQEVKPGIEAFLAAPPSLVLGKRLGLITNRSAVDRAGVSDIDRLTADPRWKLVRLFSPEHGLRADRQGSIVDGKDPVSGLPVVSLYGDTKKPTSASLQGIDVLLFDIQDVGARFYTYQSTMALAMQAAQEAGVAFCVLDRPNPITGTVEGARLDPKLASFVGYYPIPVRHGLTLGELARYYNAVEGIGANLSVVPVQGWTRRMWFDQTALPWVKPSPAMRTLKTATLYPGICLFEATNLDCRVGDRPFERVGAAWLDEAAYARALNARKLPGVRFAPFRQDGVGGVELELLDRNAFRPVRTGLVMVSEAQRLHPDRFKIEARGFDRMVGVSSVRERLLAGDDPLAIAAGWEADEAAFTRESRPFWLYQP